MLPSGRSGGSAIELKKNPDNSSEKTHKEKSLNLELRRALLGPLCLLWLLSTCVAYFMAAGFANESFDQGLVNSADSVIARLHEDGGKILSDVPPAVQAVLRHNYRDKFYYQVLSESGERISGDASLPGPYPDLTAREPVFRNAKLNGEDIRIVLIRAEVEHYKDRVVLVQAAETLHSRNQLTSQILLSIIFPQIFLILLGAATVHNSVSKGLRPLLAIESALQKRTPSDLSPLDINEVPVEVRSLVKSINALLARISGDIESQNRFVANAAHQFRTPLAGLKTYIYYAKRLVLGDDTHDDPDMRKKKIETVLDQIDSGTDRMTHLANKLLALSKADHASNNAMFETVDLNMIVSEITAELVVEAVKKDLELEFLCSDHPALVSGNPHNLTELAENLIENAVLYTEPGGRIVVSVINTGHVLLAVQDNGPGIPAGERERVFERFYRSLGTDVPGSGLGLPIVKEIATAHNAQVQITSGPSGVGTTVAVTFPSVPEQMD